MKPLARPGQYLVDHLSNTSELAWKYGKMFGMENTCRLIGLIHDYGKANPDWQYYLSHPESSQINHSYVGSCKFIECCKRVSPCYNFANIVHGHHGELSDEVSLVDDQSFSVVDSSIKSLKLYQEKNKVLESDSDILVKCGNGLPELDETIKNLSRLSENELVKIFNSQYFYIYQKMVYSSLVDADRIDASQEKYSHECKTIKDCKSMIDSYMDGLNKKSSPTKVNLARSKFHSKAVEYGKGISHGVCVSVSTPPGSGKFLSTLDMAVNVAIKTNKHHIVYLAPFLTIIDQQASICREIFNGNQNEEYFIEDHSDFSFNRNITREQRKYHALAIDRWDESPIIISTTVNFLNMISSNKASELRKLHNLADSVIIVDEVQQISYLHWGIFNDMINFLTQVCGCTVIICSATQPLMWRKELGNHRLIMDNDGENIIDITKDDLNIFEERYTVVDLTDHEMEIKDVCHLIEDEMSNVNSFMAVVNTKKEARNLYNLLNGYEHDYDLVLLYTDKTKNDIHDEICRILDLIKSGKKFVCVTTSMIEAGVDLDFDSGLRFIGGEDNVLQCAGRINRHGNRSKDKSKMFIVNLISSEKDPDNGDNLPGEMIKPKLAFLNNRNEGNNLIPCTSESMNRFYEILYFGNGKNGEKSKIEETLRKIEYPLDDITTAFDLLNQKKKQFRYSMFKTVAENYVVIPDKNSVFVNNSEETNDIYNEYTRLRNLLDKEEDEDKIVNIRRRLCGILKKITKYSVGTYKIGQDLVDEYGCEPMFEGVWVLNDMNGRYYTKEIGLDFDNEQDGPIIV